MITAAVQQPVSPPGATAATAVTDADNADWSYDPNEPRYCICNQVSYGDMVACDNSDVSTSDTARQNLLKIFFNFLFLSQRFGTI